MESCSALAISSDTERCKNPRKRNSDHCIFHDPIAQRLYHKYKKYDQLVKRNKSALICIQSVRSYTKNELMSMIKSYNHHYSLVIKELTLRKKHQSLMYHEECRDYGHMQRFAVLNGQIDNINKKLEILFKLYRDQDLTEPKLEEQNENSADESKAVDLMNARNKSKKNTKRRNNQSDKSGKKEEIDFENEKKEIFLETEELFNKRVFSFIDETARPEVATCIKSSYNNWLETGVPDKYMAEFASDSNEIRFTRIDDPKKCHIINLIVTNLKRQLQESAYTDKLILMVLSLNKLLCQLDYFSSSFLPQIKKKFNRLVVYQEFQFVIPLQIYFLEQIPLEDCLKIHNYDTLCDMYRCVLQSERYHGIIKELELIYKIFDGNIEKFFLFLMWNDNIKRYQMTFVEKKNAVINGSRYIEPYNNAKLKQKQDSIIKMFKKLQNYN